LETPPKAPLSPPSKAFAHRLDNSRTSGLLSPSPVTHTNTATSTEPECHTIPVLAPLHRNSQDLLSSFSAKLLSLLPAPTLQLVRAFQQLSGCISTTYYPPDITHPSNAPTHRHYPMLESEILHLANHIGSLHLSSSTIDNTCVSNYVRSLQIGVSEAIHNSEDDELFLVEETLLLV
jgi:hypothetical protein